MAPSIVFVEVKFLPHVVPYVASDIHYDCVLLVRGIVQHCDVVLILSFLFYKTKLIPTRKNCLGMKWLILKDTSKMGLQ